MSIVPIYVGLDYHDDSIRVCIMDHEGSELVNRNRPNDVEMVGEFVLQYGFPQSVAIEACSGAASFAHSLERMYRWPVRLAHPGYVSRLKQGPDKSDHDDAQVLADLLRVDYLPDVWLAPEVILQLRRLVHYRQSLAHDRKNVKLRIRALLREERVPKPEYRPWTKPWKAWVAAVSLGEQASWVMQRLLRQLELLENDIHETEQRLEEITADDPVVQKLLGQRGVGLITAVTMRAEIGTFERFHSGKQLARFCSVTPLNASTGKRQADAGLVKQGNPELRRVVIQAAHRISRHVEKWNKLRHRLVCNGKPTSLAIAAVANRWVRWLYHQMVSPTPVAA